MKSVLRQLYDGDIAPCEQSELKSKAYAKVKHENIERQRAFAKQLQTLDPPLDWPFIELLESHMKECALGMEESFIEGFRLGARMAIEVCRDDLRDEET